MLAGVPGSLSQLLLRPLPRPWGGTRPPSYVEAIPPGGPLVSTVALVDLELRTAVASLIALSATPAAVLRGRGRDHREATKFYAALADTAGVGDLFPPVPDDVDVDIQPTGRLLWAPEVCHADRLTFTSTHSVINPAVRDAFAGHKRNSLVQAMHWRGGDEPRPTIIVVHGFTGSPYWLSSSFFQLPWFYRNGCDVVLATLPFHGPRNDWPAPYNGSGLFTNGIGVFTEAILQSVADMRVLVGHLVSSGVKRIGMTGLSLGGYITALMAAVEPRLHVAIPNCAVTDMATLVESWFPAGQLLRAGLAMNRIDYRTHTAAVRLHSPLRFPALRPPERLFIIGGQGDRLAQPEQSARLWEHWGRPHLHWFPGSHIVHLRRDTYLGEVRRFLAATGFHPG